MIRLAVAKLEPGMVLAAPVRHPAITDHTLLQQGFALDPKTIARLQEFQVSALWIRHPGFDFLDARLHDEIPASRHQVYRTIKNSFTEIANQTSGAFDLAEYRTVIGNLIISLVADKKHAVWAERMMHAGTELFGHSANVAYLALLIAMSLRDYVAYERRHVSLKDAQDLTNLGIGAMLHDLGKLGMAEEWHTVHFLDKRAKCDEYRSHVERGYHAIRGRVEATAAAIVLHHHQLSDGSGFPKPKPRSREQSAKSMKGQNIHIFSRIVAVANVIDALTALAEKRARPLVAALAELQRPVFRKILDPAILDAALRVIPPFPLGALVELSNGRDAVVIDLNESEPCQPKVGLLDSSTNLEDKGCEEIDLSQENVPSIARYAGHEVSGYFYTLADKEKCLPEVVS